MLTIAKYIGGSHLYGLETQDSDIDYRGVYLSEDVANIIGLSKDEVVADTREFGDDLVMFELRRFLRLLRKTNTMSIEALFVPQEKMLELNGVFIDVIEERENLINSKVLLDSTRGYVKSEARLALGERTGRLGGKRKAQLEKYGFSPKNACQIIRIVVAAEEFLKSGIYPLNIKRVNKSDFDLAYKIKVNPHLFSADDIGRIVSEYDKRILEATDQVNFVFDEDIANEILLKAYFPILKKHV